MKDRNIEQVMLRGRMKGEGEMKRVKEAERLMYFLYRYDYETLKPAKVTLRR
jgi:hypothetical protein